MGGSSEFDWDVEHVEHEPMGHEWGDAAAFDDPFELPLESRLTLDSGASVEAASLEVPALQNVPYDAATASGDFGGGSEEIDPGEAFDETVPLETADPSTLAAFARPTEPDRPFSDPETEHEVIDIAEIDPFDAFDEEFAQVIEELEVELPALEEMAEG